MVTLTVSNTGIDRDGRHCLRADDVDATWLAATAYRHERQVVTLRQTPQQAYELAVDLLMQLHRTGKIKGWQLHLRDHEG
jgi:hypothetical protein